jgi:hypothetical protein
MERKELQVVQVSSDVWMVKTSDGSTVLSRHSTQTAAEGRAKEVLRRFGGGIVSIYDSRSRLLVQVEF